MPTVHAHGVHIRAGGSSPLAQLRRAAWHGWGGHKVNSSQLCPGPGFLERVQWDWPPRTLPTGCPRELTSWGRGPWAPLSGPLPERGPGPTPPFQPVPSLSPNPHWGATHTQGPSHSPKLPSLCWAGVATERGTALESWNLNSLNQNLEILFYILPHCNGSRSFHPLPSSLLGPLPLQASNRDSLRPQCLPSTPLKGMRSGGPT